MRTLCLALAIATALCAEGPYKIVKTAKVGGAGGFDYVYADVAGRKLYIPRTGPSPRVTVFNLDTLEPEGEIADTNARGAAVDTKSGHAFASSKPVTMWDSKTLAKIRTIDVEGNPDGILADPFNGRIYIFSHTAPHATVIDAADGKILGTIDLGGAPEQAVSNGKGTVYVAIEDKDNIAVIDVKAMKVTAHYDLAGKGGTCAGLAMDVKNHILFAACRKPQMMVIMNADDGKILETLPIGAGVDGAFFHEKTHEVFSSQGDGTLTVIKEKSPSSFVVEQTVETPQRAKTLTLDSKTDRVLLITADFAAAAPAPAGGGKVGRPQMVPDSFSIVVVGK
jgi:DNA-binding beta-propeller fold protein YncE